MVSSVLAGSVLLTTSGDSTESRLPLSFFVKGRNNCLSLLECGSWCLEYAAAATGEAGEEGGGLGGQDSESHRPSAAAEQS